MIGEVDNGRRGVATIGKWSGPAGLKERGDAFELAYAGPSPRSFPVEVEFDGDTFQAAARLTVGVPVNFVVLILRQGEGRIAPTP